VEVDDGLTVAERAEKVKQALDEYKALDHEDMVGRRLNRESTWC
jgi:protein KRI1